MSETPDKKYWLDDPKNVKKVLYGLYILCALLISIDLIHHRHGYFEWEEFFGFYAFYGLGACVILVLLAKEMRKFVARHEEYYDKLEDEQ